MIPIHVRGCKIRRSRTTPNSAYFVGTGDTHHLAGREAVAGVANWRSPVLLVHGDDDRNVPFQQTTDLVEKLRAQ
jgi:dipeptidyl aminopeptidase/acylaminoacyl peptidase